MLSGRHARQEARAATGFLIGIALVRILAWRSMNIWVREVLRGQGGGLRGSRSSERTFKLGGQGGHGDQRGGYVRYPEVRENIFKKSSQTFPHSPTSSQTSLPSPTSQLENPPPPPGNSPTSRSFSSA
ncbi:hypothetical protein RCIA188 [Methanocella arvoryzae MRE50]|uniref:Uncharacterized protein n=1 Tax=Methanocella arvoryzae (strain DSM 22066 / NBRC 105507 / MRE50) TaxID=351160 RepID=Q0W1Z2_METAR|nr:hypothetical protein RCIA188 [Methanocella arvoryzae MRE50]